MHLAADRIGLRAVQGPDVFEPELAVVVDGSEVPRIDLPTEAVDGGMRDDGCKASCVDWYGNARPIFLGDRVLALMGYEIVEGRLQAGGWRFDEPTGAPAPEQIVERRRVSFAPNAAWREGRYWPFN